MRGVVAGLSAVLVLSACSVAEEGPEPEPPAKLRTTDVSSLRVSGQQEQETALSVSLSPDGKTVMSLGRDGRCLRGVDGSYKHCPVKAFEFDIDDPAWSPDGRMVAITEEYAFGVEPDVWVIDVASGDLTNLTDDGVESDGISLTSREMPEGAQVDVSPSWSEDGKRIRFLRRESANSAGVMSVSPAGGEPERLGTIDTSWEKLQTVAWAEDSVAWLSGPPDDRGGEVFVAGLSGESRKVLDGEYRVLSFSSDGNFLLADQRDADGNPGVGTARVVPARGGDPVPVADGQVTYPGWGPEGHAIAYVEAPGTLRVVGKPGGTPHDLYQQSDISARDGVAWVPGRMAVVLDGNRPVVLAVDGS
ncbi:TolB family protein [Actinophytocola sp. NPDC049390]|uniref:TolB family protein n=1 Tax=Actinophytocola sp. NPDC049390 TaxID=3363894 RepID=UPI0037A5577F